MDQGAAAVWAAGIGVGGVVLTAGMGWYVARKAAAAQIEAAQRSATAQVQAVLAGVQAQFSGQRREALWQVRREACTAFLGQVEAVRVAVTELADLCDDAYRAPGEPGAVAPDLVLPRNELADIFKALWLRDAALRLALNNGEAEEAEQLRLLVIQAVSDVSALVDDAQERQHYAEAREISRSSIDELHEGIVGWTRHMRAYLNAGEQAELPEPQVTSDQD
ncbi:hypothetical protein ACFYUL_23910 [Streptomyces sp. NPDC004311]|uniref:hypothetical protein n=1 Tax=Streptomyces sp. NPDC004311 TaxID=3364698 RepID=UPI00368A67E5